MAFSGHKIHALQGTGCLFLRAGVKFQPLLAGGPQEQGRRAGTENVLGIASWEKLLKLLSGVSFDALRDLRNQFEATLRHEIPKLAINGEGPRTSNVSNVAFLGVDGEALLLALDQAGIAASHGSACSSGSLEPSRALLAMGLPLARVNASIRFSFSRMTTPEEIDAACEVIIPIVRRYTRDCNLIRSQSRI